MKKVKLEMRLVDAYQHDDPSIISLRMKVVEKDPSKFQTQQIAQLLNWVDKKTPLSLTIKKPVKKEEEENPIEWHPCVNYTKSFQLGDEPYMMHIMKSGFKDKYAVLHENAFDGISTPEYLTLFQIEEKYKVKMIENNADLNLFG